MSRKKDTKQEIDVSNNEKISANGEKDANGTIIEEELTLEQKLQEQIVQLQDKLFRTVAEFENYKKRVTRQYEDIVRSANDKIIIEIIEMVDNFERALQHNSNTDIEAYHKGIELIFNQMMNLIKKYDITPIEAIGKPFDPNLHEAVIQIESDEYDEGIVALEIGKGYIQEQRVIRHSKVGVSTGKKEDSNNENTANDDEKKKKQ